MKRLVIDARESGTSTGRYVDKLIEYLAKLKPDFEVIVLTKADRLDYLKQVAPGFKIIKSNYKEFTFAEQLGLAWQLYKLRPTLVHFTMPQQPVFYFGKVITTFHDLTTTRFNNPSKNWLVYKLKQIIYKIVIWWTAHKSKGLITVSDFTRQELVAYTHINPAKAVVTHLAADKISGAPELVKGVHPGKFIMYVGRPLPHKNLGRLVEAFTNLQKNHPDLQLVLSGKKDALFTKIEAQTKEQHIKNIIFTDFVSEGQLRWLYENTAAYVFPSLSEGFGLPGLEAMAHGAPVVAAQATCLPEIYADGALYFDPLSSQDIAQKVDEVLASPKLRAELISRGKIQVAKYSWVKTAEETVHVYKKFIG